MSRYGKNKMDHRYLIRIPKEISVVHCGTKNILYFSGSKGSRSLKLSVQVVLLSHSSSILVSGVACAVNSSHLKKKKIKMVRGLVVARIKQILVEITGILYKKLSIVGVGYRAFFHEHIPNQIYFKLGFSHLIYFNVPLNITIKINKFTKLYVCGIGSVELLSSTVSNIRDCKLPEPYKGKGIIRDQEKILLKKGKKI